MFIAGPFDIDDEKPSPSSIVGRRDNVRPPKLIFVSKLTFLCLARVDRSVAEMRVLFSPKHA